MKSKSITRCMISVLILLLSAIPCYAGFGGSATPDFPNQVTEGDTNLPVGLDLIPNITGTDTGPVILTQITLIPSCGNQTGTGTCALGDADPGVFSVSASGTGAVACAGINFTIAETDAATGQVTFTPNSPISLNSGQDCRINFTVNVIQLPSKDAGVAAGLQTAQEARFVILKNSVLVGTGTGSDLTAVLGCGDSVIQAPETCDPPLSVPTTPSGNTNTCRNSCTYCGDGIVNNGEVCDDGNHINTDGCRNNCTSPSCGDGILDPGEHCDGTVFEPSAPSSHGSCRTNCTYCGDGIINNGEVCDDGNSINGDGCENDCTETPPACGDGNLDLGETCDPPGSTPTIPSGNTNTCRSDCTYCGDGVRDSGEQCDDGNTVAGDGCEPNCTTPAPPTVQVPTMTEWGMIIFMFLAGFVAIYYLRKQKKANR